MLVFEQILLGVVLPALVALVCLVLAFKPWVKAPAGERRGAWGPPVAFGAAYVCLHLAVVGVPDFPPSDDKNWLVYLALFAMGAGLVEAFVPANRWLRWPLRAGVALLGYWLELGFMVEHHWSATAASAWLGMLTLATVGIIATIDEAAEANPGASVPLALVVLSSGAAIVLALTGSAMLGQIMGGLAAATGAAMVLAWWQRLRASESAPVRLSRGGATVYGILFGGLVAYGYCSTADIPAATKIFGDYQAMATLLVGLAPFMLWASRQGPLSRLAGWKAAIVSALLVALPLGGALYLAANPPKTTREEPKLEGVDYDALYQ